MNGSSYSNPKIDIISLPFHTSKFPALIREMALALYKVLSSLSLANCYQFRYILQINKHGQLVHQPILICQPLHNSKTPEINCRTAYEFQQEL